MREESKLAKNSAKRKDPNEISRKLINSYKKSMSTSQCFKNNSKKSIGNNGGKIISMSQLKDMRDSVPKKISDQKIRVNKPFKKSRNPSKHSVARYSGSQMKTYQSVLKNRKELNAQNVTSPEEKKARSGKTAKSSMTSSTQTNTANKKKRGNMKSYAETKNNL